jgi:WS/DGAT/MGAT family acyltransferase
MAVETAPIRRRLSGFDAQFVYHERPAETQHTLKVVFLEPPGGRRVSPEVLRKAVVAQLKETPLGWRLARVPLDLHHPVWVTDPDVDLEARIHLGSVPAPGGRRDLCRLVSELARRPLDLDGPPWEMWLLDGVEDATTAVVIKMSHALADGGATAGLLRLVFGAGRSAATAEPPPGRLRLLRDALVDAVRDLFVGVPRLVRRAREVRRERKGGVAAGGTIHTISAPEVPINVPLTPERSFYYETVPLRDAREVHSAFDVSINDVIWATVAGGLRRYLAARDALPERPLVSAMVVSTRKPEEEAFWGNRVNFFMTSLPTDVDDPTERVRRSHEACAAVKREDARARGAQFEDWYALFPPFLVKLAGVFERLAMTRLGLRPSNVIVSNVRGPEQPLEGDLGRVSNLVSVGHLKNILGLNITVWSYAEHLNFALYACPVAVPDIEAVGGHLLDSFRELLEAARLRRID